MNRKEFKQLSEELLFAFIFVMVQLVGIGIVFKDQLF